MIENESKGSKKVRDLKGRELYSVLISTSRGTPYRNESKAYNHLVDAFNKDTKYKRFEAVQWFFTNVARALRSGNKGFSVKLSKDYWTGNDCGIGAKNVKFIIDYMEKEGYVILLKGSHDYRDEDLSYVSIVRFTQKLIDLFNMHDVELYIPSSAIDYPIVMKDRKTKEIVEVVKTEEVEKMAEEMNRYNESLVGADIRFDGETVPLLEYQRTFSGDFNSGGRLFAHGGSIQVVPQEFRLSAITIEGEPVVELDYSANHPRILYELLGQRIEDLDVNPSIDPYSCDSEFLNVDRLAVENHKMEYGLVKYDPVRNFMKHAMMRALNCDSFEKALASLSTEFHKDKQKSEHKRKFIGLVKPDCRLTLSAICDQNEKIVGDFFQDKGIWLQHMDSEVALRVIDLMLQSGEVVLCWHDSFQCRESAKDLLMSAMMDAWKDVIGSDVFVKVDKK